MRCQYSLRPRPPRPVQLAQKPAPLATQPLSPPLSQGNRLWKLSRGRERNTSFETLEDLNNIPE